MRGSGSGGVRGPRTIGFMPFGSTRLIPLVVESGELVDWAIRGAGGGGGHTGYFLVAEDKPFKAEPSA